MVIRTKPPKKEFSKTLLIQESALIWIITLSFVVLAFYCVSLGFTGSLPWLAAMVSLPWAAYGVSQIWYYKKSIVENSKDGIKYETVLKDIDEAYKKYWKDIDTSYYTKYYDIPLYTDNNCTTNTNINDIDPYGPI